jgi:bifunctional pyridoxal-dependent enzyme with beta-cystathionase and maltose regulon repressor activities
MKRVLMISENLIKAIKMDLINQMKGEDFFQIYQKVILHLQNPHKLQLKNHKKILISSKVMLGVVIVIKLISQKKESRLINILAIWRSAATILKILRAKGFSLNI